MNETQEWYKNKLKEFAGTDAFKNEVFIIETEEKIHTLESRIAALEQRNRALVEALKAIEEGCSYPEDEVQRAVRDRAKQALKEAEQCPTQP